MSVRNLPTRDLLALITKRKVDDEMLERPLLEILKKPVGDHYPTQLLAAGEIMQRAFCEEMRYQDVIDDPEAMRSYLRLHFAGKEHECFVVLFLTLRYSLIEAVELFRGTLNQTSVYPREVVKAALERNASAVVFAHNHPSGSCTPSHADRSLTQNLKAALSCVDVSVLDHLIVSGTTVHSMAAMGEM